jgi:hypothetical protein
MIPIRQTRRHPCRICEVCERHAAVLITRTIDLGPITACEDCWLVWDEDMEQ